MSPGTWTISVYRQRDLLYPKYTPKTHLLWPPRKKKKRVCCDVCVLNLLRKKEEKKKRQTHPSALKVFTPRLSRMHSLPEEDHPSTMERIVFVLYHEVMWVSRKGTVLRALEIANIPRVPDSPPLSSLQTFLFVIFQSGRAWQS